MFDDMRVDKFLADIAALSADRYQIAETIRELFFAVDKNLDEDIKYGGLVFLQDTALVGGVFFYKAHISIEFSEGAQMSDPHTVLEGGGKYRRHIKLTSASDIAGKHVDYYVNQALEK